MKGFLTLLSKIPDRRQKHKVLHKLKDIIVIVIFARFANADDWQETYEFAHIHEKFLKKYIDLENGIPSHDTLERNFSILDPKYLEAIQKKFNDLLSKKEGQKLKKILAIDGKTQCGNANKNQKANHIVSAVDENGICLGQSLVENKSNEIIAIPELLDKLNIKDQIVTIDAMGTQTNIVKKITEKKADYVLALKKNHKDLYEDLELYFKDEKLFTNCEHYSTIEKARGAIETREYWHTNDISWVKCKERWYKFKSIAMTKNTIKKNGKTTVEKRYFISSLKQNVKEIARSIRGHWVIESFHLHLDVTFKEDANKTIQKRAAYNLNIIRKIVLNVLKLVSLGEKPISLKKKRYRISLDPTKYLRMVLDA